MNTETSRSALRLKPVDLIRVGLPIYLRTRKTVKFASPTVNIAT